MRPVQIALALLEALSKAQPAGVTELSALTGLPRSTAQRALMSLHAAGWIEVADEKRGSWQLCLKALVVAGRAANGQEQLRNIAVPVMEECRRSSGETIHLTVRQGGYVVLIERLDGILSIAGFQPYGSGVPLGSTASGKAILAALPAEDLEAFLSQPAPALAALCIVDAAKFRDELSGIRDLGYAATFDGPGGGAVGAAIRDASGYPFAAIAALGPSSRMTPERTTSIGPALWDAAQRIGMGISWSHR